MNTNLQIIDEIVESEEFSIDNDHKAEWALRKIAEETIESQRYANVCDTVIAEYEFKKQKNKEQLDNKTSYLKQKLLEYFNSVEHKKTKTQETYKLPSGTLKLKYQSPECVRDDETLLKWLKESDKNEYVKVKESVDWAELKKIAQINGDKALTGDGEIIEGVTVVERSPKFDIEF